MNELGTLFSSNPHWSLLFHEQDRMLVESMIRLASREGLEIAVLIEQSNAMLALLLLTKSVRLQHVALALDAHELDGLLADQLWTYENEFGQRQLAPQKPEVHVLRDALINLAHIAPAIIETSQFGDELSAFGPVVVLSRIKDQATFVAIRRYAFAEQYVALRLLNLVSAAPTSMLHELRRQTSSDDGVVVVTEEQQHFIERALQYPVTVLTGGPGTGKTTAIANLLSSLIPRHHETGTKRPLRVALCAPTAKAAVRMREAIDAALEASHDPGSIAQALSIDERSGSLHRLLRIRPDNSRAATPVLADLVIVDEASMLEFGLLEQLLRSCENSHVVLVGDPDQLASVNVGAALRDIIDSSSDALLDDQITRLRTNYRSGGELVALAKCINDGDIAGFKSVHEQHPELVRRVARHSDLLEEICEHARELFDAARHDEQRALELLRERTMLCATRIGVGSLQWWRTRITRELRRFGWDENGSRRFAVGTPLLITANEATFAGSTSTLFNGDVGIVSEGTEGPHVLFGPTEHPRKRKIESIDQAEPAWALTIHKSQGSEYDDVVISLPDYDAPLLTRELLYTAVTRAKKHVTIIGNDQLVERALGRRISRVSSLKERVRALHEKAPAASTSNRR